MRISSTSLYVLTPNCSTSEEEMPKLKEGIEKAKEAVIEILKNGIDSAMNKFN